MDYIKESKHKTSRPVLDNPPYGENVLWLGSMERMFLGHCDKFMNFWFDPEYKLYNYNKTGYHKMWGHFTQIVWKNTTKIGCTMYLNVFICEYGPRGNIVGLFKDNVPKPINL